MSSRGASLLVLFAVLCSWPGEAGPSVSEASSDSKASLLRLRGGMKLFTHNLLASPVPGLTKQQRYPLALEVERAEIRPSKVDQDTIISLLERLNWKVFLDALQAVGGEESIGLERQFPQDMAEVISSACNDGDVHMFRALHRALFETEVMEGQLVCPATQRRFRIQEGVPNFLAADVQGTKQEALSPRSEGEEA
ncbi:hypothetical protein GUITHDRAFT_161000 [Guillardia theta CCMP2712]|uniref:Uncharacterized protein n=1 Tax=Guillardia theta (strain CCMP2712) TaxID=905079 RepID=L1JXK9_GUITC|nr:hypothetical protein GUITHDRAFT_161000 [Guillardia theta CCMP2712]EKX53286.1 hypothetical protein GUITHDRAFT_161000 [Guillardia theta CCMP2712]|eukprot:XP_005840266.1 hypothetical protein GUITHDRAFT_161000 [Guillardia theta CCMP2712]